MRIAQAVNDTRFTHTAFCRRDAPIVRDIFSEAGYQTAVYDPVAPSYHAPAHFLRASTTLARELKRRHIHLLHCADVLAAFYVSLASRLARLPVLCHVRNRYADLTWREQSFLLLVNHFVFVSHNTWRRFALRVPARKGTVVYDGAFPAPGLEDASDDVRREFGIPASARIIGMVARVAPQKDYLTLAKAAARLRDAGPDLRFLVVGDHGGAEEFRAHYEEVRRALASHGVAASFVFTGHRADVARLISAMDVFVLSTHFEGLPLAILEAMAQAKPVIVTAVDGVPELVRHGQTGLLYTHEDHEQLADQILSLVQDQPRARALGMAGYRFVHTSFSGERFAAAMLNLYCRMLRIAPPPLKGEATLSEQLV